MSVLRFDERGLPVPNMHAARSPFPVPCEIVEEPDPALMEIVAMMYQAAGGASHLWLEALGKLREEFGGNAGQITQVDLAQKRLTLNLIAVSGLDLIELDQYEDRAFEDDLAGVIASFPGRAISSELHISEDTLQSRVDLGLVPGDFSRFVIIGHIIGSVWCLIGVTRSPNAPPFTEADCARFGTLSADFRRIQETVTLREALRASPDAAIATLRSILRHEMFWEPMRQTCRIKMIGKPLSMMLRAMVSLHFYLQVYLWHCADCLIQPKPPKG
jgi:hypothetical protein